MLGKGNWAVWSRCGRANVELSPSYEDVLIPAAGIGLVSPSKNRIYGRVRARSPGCRWRWPH